MFTLNMGHRVRCEGFGSTAIKNTSTNIDYKIEETRKIQGVQLFLRNQEWADTIKFQVVDKDNILGLGANHVLDEFGKNWNICTDQQQQQKELFAYLAKINAGLYVRIVYTSTGTVNDVDVKVNLYMHIED